MEKEERRKEERRSDDIASQRLDLINQNVKNVIVLDEPFEKERVLLERVVRKRKKTRIFNCLYSGPKKHIECFLEISVIPEGIGEIMDFLDRTSDIHCIPKVEKKIHQGLDFYYALIYRKEPFWLAVPHGKFLIDKPEKIAGVFEEVVELANKLHERDILLPRGWYGEHSMFITQKEEKLILLDFSNLFPVSINDLWERKISNWQSVLNLLNFYKGKMLPPYDDDFMNLFNRVKSEIGELRRIPDLKRRR